MIARESSNVLGSGTVGPEAITAGSSPGTSLIARVTTRAGRAAAASRPPLMAERCLRTQFISEMFAPDASKARLIACLSASERPAAGAAHNADPPPEISASTRSSEPKPAHALQQPTCASFAVGIRHGVRGLDHLDVPSRHVVAVGGDDGAFERDVGPGVFHCGSHHGRRLAAAHDDAASPGLWRQMRGEHLARIGRRDGGIEQRPQCGSGARVVPDHRSRFPFDRQGREYGEARPDAPCSGR